VFARGSPETIADVKRPQYSATIYDLLSAYATQREKRALSHVRFAKRTVWSLAEARLALQRMIGTSTDWSRLDQYLLAYVVEPSLLPTVLASSFAATLELVREGMVEVHQHDAFAPIYLRKRAEYNEAGGPGDHGPQPLSP
jgi:segregation and condensation protein A